MSRRNSTLLPALGLAMSGCGRLDQLLYQPLTTPQQWCERRPCVPVGDLVFNEPLGALLVFSLAFLWIGVGVHFLQRQHGQRSRLWLGVALVLGGVGAAQAGISYQAFSYLLKCAGREHCLLTNGFEVGYSLTQALSVSAMLTAVAYASAAGRGRRGLIIYASINAAAYVVVTVAGILLPSAWLLSFEVLTLFALPGIFLVMAIAAGGLAGRRASTNRALFAASALLLGVEVAYFAYAAGGITQRLWDNGRGFYFSENDVLHIGMIAWLAYVYFALGKRLNDCDRSS